MRLAIHEFYGEPVELEKISDVTEVKWTGLDHFTVTVVQPGNGRTVKLHYQIPGERNLVEHSRSHRKGYLYFSDEMIQRCVPPSWEDVDSGAHALLRQMDELCAWEYLRANMQDFWLRGVRTEYEVSANLALQSVRRDMTDAEFEEAVLRYWPSATYRFVRWALGQFHAWK